MRDTGGEKIWLRLSRSGYSDVLYALTEAEARLLKLELEEAILTGKGCSDEFWQDFEARRDALKILVDKERSGLVE